MWQLYACAKYPTRVIPVLVAGQTALMTTMCLRAGRRQLRGVLAIRPTCELVLIYY
jgi:hypothetical protein